MKTERPHAHICPDCKHLFWCDCPERWKVIYVSCGCAAVTAPVVGAIPEHEIPY